jgi:hypothetical protein
MQEVERLATQVEKALRDVEELAAGVGSGVGRKVCLPHTHTCTRAEGVGVSRGAGCQPSNHSMCRPCQDMRTRSDIRLL